MENYIPAIFWIFSNTIYEVNDTELVEKIKTPAMEQKKSSGDSILGGIVAIFLANLLRPLGDYFDLPSNYFINTIIVIIVIILVWLFYIYLNIRCKKSLYQVIHLEKYPKKRLRVRPQSFKSFRFIIFSYLFFLALTFLGFYAFIQIPNAMVLICGMAMLFSTMLVGFITVALGDNKVKFKKEKKEAFQEMS